MKRLNKIQDKLVKYFLKKNRGFHAKLLENIAPQIKKEIFKEVLSKEVKALALKQKDLMDDVLNHTSFSYLKDKKKVKKIVKRNWSGDLYSTRIYKDKTKLKKTIIKEVTKALKNEEANEEILKKISRRLDISLNNAKRLMDTEITRVINESNIEKGLKDGYTHYKFIATIDDRTSDSCRELNGSVIPLYKFNPGVNAGPLHPHCRSRIELIKK